MYFCTDSPGSEGSSALLLPVTCSLLANLDANATSQTSIVRADGRDQGIKSYLPKAAHAARGQLGPSALPSAGGEAKL